MGTSRDTEYITASGRACIPHHPANVLGLPAEGRIRLHKYRKSETLPVQTTKAQRGSRGIIPLILDLGATWGVGGKLQAPAALSAGTNSIFY
jgi:hypothetical protein